MLGGEKNKVELIEENDRENVCGMVILLTSFGFGRAEAGPKNVHF